MAAWAHFPDEILFRVARFLSARDAYALGATCQRLHDIVADQHLWRRLFVRDFAHLYNRGLPAQAWPHATHPDDPWPQAAVDLWEGTDALDCMPPRCPPVPDLPAPFAHAFAVGKDWLWLYRAHAVTSTNPWHAGPFTLLRDRSKEVGDQIDYVVTLEYDSGDDIITSWKETVRSPVPFMGWVVSCDQRETVHHTRGLCGEACYAVSPRGHPNRMWERRRIAESGPRTIKGPTSLTTFECIDGVVTGPTYHGLSHGITRSIFANGDVLTRRFVYGDCVEVLGFACSPTCLAPHYAGKTLSDCHWRKETVSVGNRRFGCVFPADGDSDHARLFWDYVRDGLIGWHPDVRRAVLDQFAPPP
ncbi:F-box domain containing protein [Pandoravirus neocaledonia]|uniref:F-box domain containing protein n=1 Tax=Pandoravirus neocaledonia TaxID=2107708 RepID=A0A2U7UDY1_9VIRU|nr:F-box domain containing protein [Pandoravirus neocaledonia]AVK76612.1 F-box domain containing protein [Pandoravirus neocaledonia]